MIKAKLRLTSNSIKTCNEYSLFLLSKKFYLKQENRWASYYSQEYEVNRLGYTYVEAMNMPLPYVANYYHEDKSIPKDFHPDHINDFRYNFSYKNYPSKNFESLRPLKLYNTHSVDSLMHGVEWRDYQPDYQIEEPMESNHYIQNTGPLRIYSFYGYGVVDNLEDMKPYRKRFYKPDQGLTFKNYKGFNLKNSNRDYVKYDSEYNMYPARVYRYPFVDENTFRI